jgi:hypothetical protein
MRRSMRRLRGRLLFVVSLLMVPLVLLMRRPAQ